MNGTPANQAASLLIVDDEPNNFDVIEVALTPQGYQLHYANSADHTWQQLELTPIDVILLDVMMPHQNGISLCRQLKAHPKGHNIPILMITALTGKQDLASALAAGADDFLSKPFHNLELQARVASLARIKKQQDQLRNLLKSREAELHFRQKAEITLAKTNEKLQAVIDAVPGFISWIGPDLRYRGVNQRLADAAGISPDAFIGQKLGFLDCAEEFETFIQKFMQQSNQEITQPILNIQVQENRREYLIVAQKYEQGQSIVTVGIDITEWKQTERELQATTTQLKTLLDTLKSGVLLQDKNGNVIAPNQAFYDIFGLQSDHSDLSGKSNAQLELCYQHYFANPEKFCQQSRQLLQQQIALSNEEWTLVDGRTLERDYAPIFLEGSCQGHLWMYRDITERKCDEKQIKESLQEKELLLKEIHHRVKNNLFVVSNLLDLQGNYTEDEKLSSLLHESRNRVHSMALIHQKLYRTTGLSRINFADYLNDLVPTLSDSYINNDHKVKLELTLETIWLNIETANPCGLIVNELLSNAFQHAFPDYSEGKVGVQLFQNRDHQITLIVKDNGIGLPKNFDPKQVKSLGMELVLTLIEQIRGKLVIANKNGASFQITFQEVKYRQRY